VNKGDVDGDDSSLAKDLIGGNKVSQMDKAF